MIIRGRAAALLGLDRLLRLLPDTSDLPLIDSSVDWGGFPKAQLDLTGLRLCIFPSGGSDQLGTLLKLQ